MLHYVDKCYLNVGSYPYVRFIVQHNKKPVHFESEELKLKLKEEQIYLNVDRLQSRNTICIGWLMGSHPKAVNSRDLEEVIKKFQFPEEAEDNIKPYEFQCEVRS